MVSKFDKFKEITDGMAGLYAKKNKDYGDSFSRSFKEFGLDAPIIRLSDKLQRLKTLSKQEAKVKDESIRDTLIDLANYSVMTVIELEDEKLIKERTERLNSRDGQNNAQNAPGMVKNDLPYNSIPKEKKPLKDDSVSLVYVFDYESNCYRVIKAFRDLRNAKAYVNEKQRFNTDMYHYEVMRLEEYED